MANELFHFLTGKWDEVERRVVWCIPQMLSQDDPVVCLMHFSGSLVGEQADEVGMVGAMKQQNIQVRVLHTASELSTLRPTMPNHDITRVHHVPSIFNLIPSNLQSMFRMYNCNLTAWYPL